MPICECENCGNAYKWSWEEAFDKFGFNDGLQVMTYDVEGVLTDVGYTVVSNQWGLHNTLIFSIQKDGQELMPTDDAEFSIGYDCPRDYLPQDIITLLDTHFPKDGE